MFIYFKRIFSSKQAFLVKLTVFKSKCLKKSMGSSKKA